VAVTLDNLRVSAKVLANHQQSSFLSDTEWALLVNKGYRDLYAEVVEIDPQFRVTTASTVTLTPTANSMTLASDFMNLLAVVRYPGIASREYYLNPRGIRPTGELEYRIEGNKIYVEPLSAVTGQFNYRYVPQVADLADPGGTMDVELEQFRKYVELSAAVDCLASDECDITTLASLFGVQKGRVRDWAKKRRKTDHEVVEDVRRARGWNRMPLDWLP